MNIHAAVLFLTFLGCASEGSAPADEVTIDDLQVTDKTSIETIGGLTVPAIKGTFSAHAASNLTNAIVSIPEFNFEQKIQLPGNARSITRTPFILGFADLPEGPHTIGFRVVDAKGKESKVLVRTVLVSR
jgi:hypothetical protein